MQIYGAQEQTIYWMGMDPTDGHHLVIYLGLKHFHFISHIAVIFMSTLFRNDQCVND